MEHAGYLLEPLTTGRELTLYRGHRTGEPSVLLFGPTADQTAPENVERLTHEYALGADLDAAWAAIPLSLIRHDGRPLLVLEDHGGEPLDRVLAQSTAGRLQLEPFLEIAIELVRAVGGMHARGLVHKDIKPPNVLVDRSGHVRLTGFGLASRLHRERQPLAPPEVIAGSFAYMAPEQTGRMNRSVDARSDLYSLGATMYELLTGAPPFTAADPMEWIHCHVARQPVPPSARVDGVPLIVDTIVLKLLAKNPEDRYQTAAGLELDLQRCVAQRDRNGQITPFTLAVQDVPTRLIIPEKLYGRDGDVAVVTEALEQVRVRGTTGLVLVSGYAGIGKSSIVSELHKALLPSRGLFAAGKFDQYKRDIPYATLAQAFQALIRQLLTKTDEELTTWRATLLEALDGNGQLLMGLIPELALIIGEQPPPAALQPQDAAARFQRVVRSLVGVFARPEHPLVLFIDDLQWLDTGTLDVLSRLVSEPTDLHLLLIGAYRDNEVGPTHPLARTLSAMRESAPAIAEISLARLTAAHVAQLCADALHTDQARVASLAQLIADKTGGNPFFAIQFILTLADEQLLTFDPVGPTWQWDIERIRAKGITDNVADLMAAKLSRLQPATREALGQLACLGNVSAIDTAAQVRKSSEDEVQSVLREAVEGGLVLRASRSFAFAHDRVHEAAYALVPPRDRAATHLRIGRILLAVTSAQDLDDRIFEIVNQFAHGLQAIESDAERESVAGLYLAAGRRAKASSAYASALAYFLTGRTLVGDDAWTRNLALTLELELGCAECEIIGGELATAEERLARLAPYATVLSDRVQVVCLSVLVYFTTGRSERAVDVALAFLAGVGIEWTIRPGEAAVRAEYMKMRELLAEQTQPLLDLPAMTDPGCIAVMAVLTELFPAAYAVDRYLMELVLLRMTTLSLEHGHAESSSVAYSALNMALGSHFSDYATAYRLGVLACELVDRRGIERYKARVYSCFAAFSMPWFKHLSLCRPMMVRAFEIGRSNGDMAFASYNSRNLMTHLFMSGTSLATVQREAEQAMAFAQKLQLGLPAERFIMQLALVKKVRSVSVDAGQSDDEWALGDVEVYPQLAMMVCYHWVFKLEERLLAGDVASALDAAAHVERIRWAMRSSIEEAEYDFYAALAHAVACDRASAEEREEHLRALAVHHQRIAVWTENCPENFANRKALIGAEIARLEQRTLDAQQLFEDAIQLAREHGFIHNQAFACERAGAFYSARGLHTAANAYLQQARDSYERWGALGKVRMLDAQYPQLKTRDAGIAPASTVDKPLAQLDVEIVDKASQTLSSETALPVLLEKLVRSAVEHAGAERGLLVLLHDGEPYVEAEATTGPDGVEVALRRTRVTSSHLPESALQFVLRTHERLILDDASTEAPDIGDDYVRRNRPRSVLCLPIFKETQLIGALYLENNLTTRAFTAGRVAVLDFLASQAAIWLENARLYSELRRNEAWLRKAQELSLTGSFYWRVDLDTLECSEQMFRIYELDPRQPVTLGAIASRMHPDDLPLMQETIDNARGPASDIDQLFRAQMPDGAIKHLHCVAHAMRDSDGRLEYIGAVQDVTEHRISEETLGRVRSELAHVARVTSLGVLTASIAHEVNQPLASIVTNATTCLRMLGVEPPNLEGARETTRRMMRDGHRAAEVIARLRALFVRTDATPEPVDLNEATREVITLSATELRKSGVVLRAELAENLPPVIGDRVQLQQVILNLLLNAADAVQTVNDRPRQVIVRTEHDPEHRVRLIVQDAGIGIDVQTTQRLFDAFYSTKPGGMGIGLSISRSIIESHRGQIWAAPNDGVGSSVGFALPTIAMPQPVE